jgi:hypothetical protein
MRRSAPWSRPGAVSARSGSTDAQKQRLRALPGYDAMSLGIGSFGAAAWRAPGRWQQGAITVVSAFDAAFRDVGRRRVLAFAYLPFSGFGLQSRIRGAMARAQRPPGSDTTLAAAARLTRLDARAVEAFLALRERHVSESLLIATIGQWLAAASGLDQARRAAALLVADRVVPGRLDPEAWRLLAGLPPSTTLLLRLRLTRGRSRGPLCIAKYLTSIARAR